MNRHTVVLFTILSIVCCCSSSNADWLRFRGPNGTGISETAVPTKFGPEKNLKWKLELPGKGVSSPVIVGDKVFITCYSGYGIERDKGSIEDLKRHLLCIDRQSGKILWEKTVDSVPEEDPYTGAGVPAHGYASHTPVTDGERVFVFFGKSGVVAYDLAGQELWRQSVGTDSGRKHWGSASSPIIYKDLLIVTASDEAESLFAFDKATGEQKWKSQDDSFADTWGTPALAAGEDGTDVVLAVPGKIRGINVSTGETKWTAPGNEGASHSVVITDQVVYSIGGGRAGSSGVAVKTGGKGEIDDLVWKNNASGRFASPVVYEGYVYGISRGILSCFNAEDGKKVFQERLPKGKAVAVEQPERGPEGERGGARGERGNEAGERGDGGGRDGGGRDGGGRDGGGRGDRERGARGGRGEGRGGRGGGERGGRGRGGRRGGQDYSSPIIADGKIYYTSGAGTVYVFAAKPEFELIAMNDLSADASGFQATPAADDGQLFVRSHSHLYCFGE